MQKAARGLQKAEDGLGHARLQAEIDALDRGDELAKIDKELEKLKKDLRKAETDAAEEK